MLTDFRRFLLKLLNSISRLLKVYINTDKKYNFHKSLIKFTFLSFLIYWLIDKTKLINIQLDW